MENKLVVAVDSSNRMLSGRRIQNQESFHINKHVFDLIEEVTQDPDADISSRIPQAVDADFPTESFLPSPMAMDDSVIRSPENKEIKFEQGQWCEYLGNDSAFFCFLPFLQPMYLRWRHNNSSEMASGATSKGY
jgi:hypothetical protein